MLTHKRKKAFCHSDAIAAPDKPKSVRSAPATSITLRKLQSMASRVGYSWVLLCVAYTFGKDQSVAYTPRSFFHARLEPEKTVLDGVGQDLASFDNYRSALGSARTPAIYMTYTSLAGTPESIITWGRRLKDELAAIGCPNVIPQIGLGMTAGKDAGAGRDALVADGSMDSSIDLFCSQLKAINRPVFVRIGYEFEGHWNDYRPATYRAAFTRITQALRKNQINAATVWCSAGASAGNKSLDELLAYYPGDDWVDWWGIDLFSPNELLAARTQNFCDAASTHRKPVMIGESSPRRVGVLAGKESWDKWFAPYFELIRQRPEIKAFCYIDWEWSEWSRKLGFNWQDWGDCRIERNSIVTKLYGQEMDLPLYQHAVENADAASLHR